MAFTRLDEINVNTEKQVKETVSRSETQVRRTGVGPSHQNEGSVSTSTPKQPSPALSEPLDISTRNTNFLNTCSQ